MCGIFRFSHLSNHVTKGHCIVIAPPGDIAHCALLPRPESPRHCPGSAPWGRGGHGHAAAEPEPGVMAATASQSGGAGASAGPMGGQARGQVTGLVMAAPGAQSDQRQGRMEWSTVVHYDAGRRVESREQRDQQQLLIRATCSFGGVWGFRS